METDDQSWSCLSVEMSGGVMIAPSLGHVTGLRGGEEERGPDGIPPRRNLIIDCSQLS